MGRKQLVDMYDEQRPRPSHFLTGRQVSILHEVSAQLNALTCDNVGWAPYGSYRVTRPLVAISLFSGFI